MFDGGAPRDSASRRSFETLIRRTGPRNVRCPSLARGIPSLNSGDAVMDNQSNPSHPASPKILKPRRRVWLASVAALGMAVLVVGAGGYRPLDLPAWTASAHAAEASQTPAGFADLVAKVKPAVISVRVKIDADSGNGM